MFFEVFVAVKLFFSIAISIVAAVSVVFASFFKDSFGRFYYKNSEKYSVGNAVYLSENIDSVEVNWVSGDILLVETNDKKLTISEKIRESNSKVADDQRLRWKIEGKKLIIYPAKSGCKLDKVKKDLILKIPKNLLGVSLNIKASHLKYERISAKNLNVKTTACSANLSFIDVNRAEFNCNATNIKLDLLNNLGISVKTIRALSSSITINNKDATKDLNAKYGNERCNLDIKTISSEIKIKSDL